MTSTGMSSDMAKRDSLLDDYSKRDSLLDDYSKRDSLLDDYSKRDSLLDNYPKRDSLLDDYPKRDSLLDNYSKRDSLLDDYPMDREYGEGTGALRELGELGEEEYYYDTSEYQFDDSYYGKYDENETYMEEENYEDEEFKSNKALLAQLYGQEDSFESSRDLDVGLDSYETDPYSGKPVTTTETDRRPYMTTTTTAITTATTTTTNSQQQQQQKQQQQQQQQQQTPFGSIPKPSLPNLSASLKSAAPMFGKFTSAMSSLGAAVSSVIPQPPGVVINPAAQNTTTRTQRATLKTQESVDSVQFPEEPMMDKLGTGPTLKREQSILKREPSIDRYSEHGELTRESSMDR